MTVSFPRFRWAFYQTQKALHGKGKGKKATAREKRAV
jgi:hypothetical protein